MLCFLFIFCGTLYLELLTSESAASAYIYVLKFCHRSKHCPGHRRRAVVQLVESLRYNPEGRVLDLHYLSGHTIAWGSTKRLTEMSTRNISWGLKAAGAYGLRPFTCRLSGSLGAITCWKPQGLYRDCFTFYLDIGPTLDFHLICSCH